MDVVARVEQDSKRNERYPKSCNIQYVFSSGLRGDERTTRSARIPFPKAPGGQGLEQLVSKVTDALAKRGDFPIHRLGLSAIDFEVQSSGGAIDSFFTKPNSPKCKKKNSAGDCGNEVEKNLGVIESSASTSDQTSIFKVRGPEIEAASSLPNVDNTGAAASRDADLEYARHLQTTLKHEFASAPESGSFQQQQSKSSEDQDLEYARRLQASFDTEERMLSALDRSGDGSGRGIGHGRGASSGNDGGPKAKKRQKSLSFSSSRKGGGSGGASAAAASKMKIDRFFSVKKK